MSLREEMARYEHLTGESAEHIPIIKLGAFLDGVDKGIEELEKIKAEVNDIHNWCNPRMVKNDFITLLNSHISELKGE